MVDLKKSVRVWAKQIGEREAALLLMRGGLSTRVAEKLCLGVYPNEPKAIRDKILKVLAKNKFSVQAEKAS